MQKWIKIGKKMYQIAMLNIFLIVAIDSRQIYFRRIHSGKIFPENIYLFKGNNRRTRKRSEICANLTIKTPERRQQVVKYVQSQQ